MRDWTTGEFKKMAEHPELCARVRCPNPNVGEGTQRGTGRLCFEHQPKRNEDKRYRAGWTGKQNW